ncbi:MAG: TolC family protein [Candidatus Omnitrophota bacterium]
MDKKGLNEFAKEIIGLLPELMRHFLRRQSHALARGKITVPQMAIMQLLMREEKCTMSDIARHLSITTAAATGLIERLFRARLVERRGHEKDRRIVNIMLTEKGKRTVEDMSRQMQSTIRDVFGRLSAQERGAYLRIVKKLCRIMKNSAVLAAAVFFCAKLFAADEISAFDVRKSVDTALRNNYTISQAKEKIEQSKEQLHQAFTAFLPVIGTANSYTRYDKATTFSLSGLSLGTSPSKTRDKNVYSLNVNMTQPIFTGGKLLGTYFQAKDNVSAASNSTERTKQLLAYEVKNAYFGILTANKLKQVNEEAIEKLQSHLNDVENLFEVGVAPKVDVMRTRVELAHIKQAFIASNNACALSETAFCNLLNISLDTKLKLEDTLEVEYKEVNLAEYTRKAEMNRPDVLAASATLDASRHGVWVARSELFPQISVTATRDRIKGQSSPVNQWKNSSYAVVSANMDIWDWTSTYSKIKEAKSKVKESRYALEYLKDNLRYEVKQAYLNLEEAQKSIEVAKTVIEMAEENYRIMQERYKAGIAINTEVLDARTALTQAKQDYYNALYGYQLAYANLEYAAGE